MRKRSRGGCNRSLDSSGAGLSCGAPGTRVIFLSPNHIVSVTTKNLPQLYRFCVLMTGDASKAQAAFQNTVREAALRAADDDPPPDRIWFFREARWRCIAATDEGLQPEGGTMDEADVSAVASKQIEQLTPEQLAIWISGAPEPQRSALAFFFLDEFNLREMLSLMELKAGELSRLIASGRRQFQAWLDATTPYHGEPEI